MKLSLHTAQACRNDSRETRLEAVNISNCESDDDNCRVTAPSCRNCRRRLDNAKQVCQESVDLRRAHLQGVALVVEGDKTSSPSDIRRLGADAVMTHAAGSADAVEKLWLLCGSWGRERVRRHGNLPLGQPQGVIEHTALTITSKKEEIPRMRLSLLDPSTHP